MDTQILWFASRATGAVSLVLFTAVMVLGIITSGRLGLPGLPRAGVLRLHRNLTLVSMAFLAVHIVTAIADGYVDLSYWDVLIPFGAGFDPFWIGLATVAVDLLIAIGITSALRLRLSARGVAGGPPVRLCHVAVGVAARLRRLRRRRPGDLDDRSSTSSASSRCWSPSVTGCDPTGIPTRWPAGPR